MKNRIAAICIGVVMALVHGTSQAKGPAVDDIIAKANHMALYQGADGQGKVSMVITDKQGRTRKRSFAMLRKNGDNIDRDQKYFVFFQSPADVRKMVFMVHKHAAPGKDDDRWLYMPSLDLVKRIAAGDKRTSFAGSDFLYEDISGRSPEADRHEQVETTDKHFIIKNTPKHPESVEFEYYTAHIDKETFMPMKMEFFKKGDRCYRVIEIVGLEMVKAEENGQPVIYPTVTRSTARDLESGSMTEMRFSGMRYNIGVKDRIFTERYLRRPPRMVMR